MILAPWQRYALAGVPAYTPAQDLGANGVWYSLTESGLLVRNTQPNNTNSDFSTWTGTYPDADPTGWTKEPDPGAASNYIADATSACRLVSNGTLVSVYRTGVVGNRYRMRATVSDITAGAVRLYNNETANLSLGSTDEDFTLVAAQMGLKRVGATDVTFTDLIFENLSVTTATPKAATGALAADTVVQATAASMPWASSTTINGHATLEFDGVADHVVSSAAASAHPYHKGGSIAFAFLPTDGTGTYTLYDTCDGDASNVGITVEYDPLAAHVTLKVANGGGTFAYNLDSYTCLPGVVHTVEAYWDGTSMALSIDGGFAATQDITGTLSAADATSTLQVGRKSGGTDFYKGLLPEYVVEEDANALGMARVGVYLRDKFGVTQASTTFSPELALGGDGIWYSLTESGLLVRNTQPSPTGWTYVPTAATLTNTAGILRITHDGADGNARATVTGGTISGNRYAIAVPARFDGQTVCRIGDGVGFFVDEFPAPSSIAWASKVGERTVASGNLWLYATRAPALAGAWGEYDLNQLSLTNLSVTTATPKAATGALVGANLVQATAAAMGWDSGAGLRFDGVGDVEKTGALTLSQPEHVYIVANPTFPGSGNAYLVDGISTNKMAMFVTSAGLFQIYAGAAGPTVAVANSTYQIFEAVFNGAASRVAVNGGAFSTGNAGSDAGGGITIGAAGGAVSAFIAMTAKEIIVHTSEDSAAVRANTIAYLKAKHGIA